MKTLRMGSRGPDVTELQNALNFLGSNIALPKQKTIHPLLTPDGIFGHKTHMRVVEFQKTNGLTADGIVGPKTFATFDALIPGGLAATGQPGGGAPGGGKFGSPGGAGGIGSPTVKGVGGAGGGTGAGKWGAARPGGKPGGGKAF